MEINEVHEVTRIKRILLLQLMPVGIFASGLPGVFSFPFPGQLFPVGSFFSSAGFPLLLSHLTRFFIRVQPVLLNVFFGPAAVIAGAAGEKHQHHTK